MSTFMVVVVGGVLVIAVVVTVALLLVRHRRGSRVPVDTAVAEPGPARDLSPPMTDLEAALERATDRSGRPMSERLDAETAHVDDLRIPDDTGPLLRRALDHVAQPSDDAPGAGASPGTDDVGEA